jgi:uncharacterized repeat protein (TIGR03803 family)
MVPKSSGSTWSGKQIVLISIAASLVTSVCAAQTDDVADDTQNSAVVGTSSTTPSFTVLYDFGPGNTTGGSPQGRLLRDSADNLYGTAGGGPNNYGVVFELSPTHVETVLHYFQGKAAGDGSYPVAGLVQDSQGNLYGTTSQGGTYDYGTVFKLTPAGDETVLHSFAGPPDGAVPWGELLLDSAGNLYGTTSEGGTGCRNPYGPAGCGTVFKLSPAGVETVLHRFKNSPDGALPAAGLIKDAKGNLYGTTMGGGNVVLGSAAGTVFRVTPGGTETVLYRFKGYSLSTKDGQNPRSTLVWDASGNLYGTTEEGGPKAWGTVFKLSPLGKETTLYSFPGKSGDGRSPEAGLVRDSAGNLYGTTNIGGNGSQCINEGCGVVFKLSATGVETVIHRFSETAKDGCSPTAALIRGPAGNLYGVTPFCGGPSGVGSMFKIVP